MEQEERRHGDVRLEAIERKIDRLLEMLNGTPDSPGILVRLDRVEQWRDSVQAVLRRFWAVLATMIAATLAKWFGLVEHIWDQIKGN